MNLPDGVIAEDVARLREDAEWLRAFSPASYRRLRAVAVALLAFLDAAEESGGGEAPDEEDGYTFDVWRAACDPLVCRCGHIGAVHFGPADRYECETCGCDDFDSNLPHRGRAEGCDERTDGIGGVGLVCGLPAGHLGWHADTVSGARFETTPTRALIRETADQQRSHPVRLSDAPLPGEKVEP